jgi:uncharacterized protein YgiM (DUF1202 family)
MFWCVLAGLAASVAGQSTQPTGAGGLVQGRIKGTNVNVRSGADTNYYIVTKLNTGDAVTIVRESFGWVEILPPQGCFSVVDKNYVDKADGGSGTLNGDVWAYAGSQVEDRRYAKQVQLKKGEKVQILGETPDNKCYKINPPEGATLWIKGEYVDHAGGAVKTTASKPALERVEPGTLNLTMAEPATKPASEPARKTSEPDLKETVFKTTNLEPIKPELLNTKNEKHQGMIAAVESRIAAESAKPAAQQNFDQFLKDLQPLASQSEDEIAKLYADTRMKQIRHHVETVKAMEQMRELRTKAFTQSDADRAKLEEMRRKSLTAFVTDRIDVRGEIRMSGIYDGAGGRAKRWRVVDPTVTPAKTLAYIELPEGSSINPADYYGKYVEIKAEARKLSGPALPVPVYIVREIRVAERPARGPLPVGVMTQPAGTPTK